MTALHAARTEPAAMRVPPVVVPTFTDRLLGYDGAPVDARPDLRSLIDLVNAAGLTGRGGAGFPTGRKLAGVAGERRRPAVVVNAIEGEPLSRKDSALLAFSAGLVVDGAEILAGALRARRAVIGVGAQIPTDELQYAVAVRRSCLEIRSLPSTFVGGQETALVRALSGGPAIPTDPAVPIRQRGLDGRPTLVVNAETAAQVALLTRGGATWFRSVGPSDDPGSRLLSISGTSNDVVGRGVVEVAQGTPLIDALDMMGVRIDLVGGVLLGGFHGAWLPRGALATRLDAHSLAPWGASAGAGVLHVLDRRHCPIAATAAIVDYLAGQSARQCGPCINGLPALARTIGILAANVDASARRRDAGLPAEIAELARLVERRGACAHPDGTARLARSMLRIFDAHVAGHLSGVCEP